MNKRLGAVTVAAVVAVLLLAAGCGGGSDSASTNAGTDTPAPATGIDALVTDPAGTLTRALDEMSGMASYRAEIEVGTSAPFGMGLVDYAGPDAISSSGGLSGAADGAVQESTDFVLTGGDFYSRKCQQGTCSPWTKVITFPLMNTFPTSSLARVDSLPLAALRLATQFSANVERVNGEALVHVSAQVNHLQAYYEHQRQAWADICAQFKDRTGAPPQLCDPTAFDNVFGQNIAPLTLDKLETVQASVIEAWIAPDGLTVRRAKLTPYNAESADYAARVVTVEYSAVGGVTVTPPPVAPGSGTPGA